MRPKTDFLLPAALAGAYHFVADISASAR